MTAADIAKQVRADIRNAIKTQTLGDYPADIKISVRSECYSGGSSIDITLKSAPEDWAFTPAGDGSERLVLSADVKALGSKIADIVEQHRGGKKFAALVYVGDTVIAAHCPR